MASVDEGAVRAELAEVCATFGKADVARRLLTYLVECHLAGKVPKETDLALDVFHRDASFDGAQDAVVRVGVRSLRQKLQEFYLGPGHDRPLRFEVPRGGYRVVITEHTGLPDASAGGATAASVSPAPAPAPVPGRAVGTRRGRLATALLALALAVSVGVNLWWAGRSSKVPVPPATAAARSSPVWQPLLENRRPLTVVLGDLLLFPAPDPAPGRIQLIRDARINTEEQLRAFLGHAPERASADPATQAPTTLLPKSVAYGLVSLLPVVSDGTREVEVRILDELPLDELRTHDVLFIGPLVRIGPLSNALFGGSRYVFEYDREPRRLRDTTTGTIYAPSPGRREDATDYGLVASFRGTTGNRIMVLASVGSDLGLQPLVRRLVSPEGLAELQAHLTKDGAQPLPADFEALISVHGYNRTDLSAQLVEAHARTLPNARQAPPSR